MPLFSIILPTHNRSTLLLNAIKSVINQKFDDWELVIIDDGSTDDTVKVVNNFKDPRVKYFYQNHGERSRARNYGIKQATGIYICFLDDDDYLLPAYLTYFHQYISKAKNEETIYRIGFYRKVNGALTPSINYDKKKHSNPIKFAAFNMCSSSSLCIPREIALKYPYNESINYWEDTQMILRLLSNHPLIQIPTYQYVYVIYDSMGSKSFYKQHNIVQLIDKNVAVYYDFFREHGNQVKTYLPFWAKRFMICDKYLDHAISSSLLKSKQISLKVHFRALYYFIPHFRLIKKLVGYYLSLLKG